MRRALLTATAVVSIGGLALPSSAAPPRKPITKTYTASAAPSVAGLALLCAGGLPVNEHREPFMPPAAGTLKVSQTTGVGDWDLVLLDAAGDAVAESANLGPGDESLSFKVKKAGAFTILSCNGLGAPTATVTYTFTFAK
ncbi:MAG TPA: hypothetical protein VNB94_07405 [Mycobacteriales bacterium]|nr:hypothetical protein [Mycobacteriales bacterium]